MISLFSFICLVKWLNQAKIGIVIGEDYTFLLKYIPS
jgi:hypothetical protein